MSAAGGLGAGVGAVGVAVEVLLAGLGGSAGQQGRGEKQQGDQAVHRDGGEGRARWGILPTLGVGFAAVSPGVGTREFGGPEEMCDARTQI